MVSALAARARRLSLLALAWAPLAAPPQDGGPQAGSQADGKRSPFEGPLANDTFVPTRQDSSARILAGDLAWAARASRTERADGALDRDAIEAFEAWRAALAGCEAGDAVELAPFPRPAAPLVEEPRHAEGVQAAVLRRLAALAPEERASFRTRFEDAASAALDAAGSDPARLAQVELENPLTAGAAKAALRLCDAALESGRTGDGTTWLARAERHVRLARIEDPAWSAALARRRAAALELAPAPAEAQDWCAASDLELVATVRFPELAPGPDHRDFGRASGLRPGAVVLDDGRIVVQTANAIFTVGDRGGDKGSVLANQLSEISKDLVWPFAAPFGDKSGDWPLTPATDGECVVVVSGRATLGRENALLCFVPPKVGELPALRWALSGLGFVDPAGARLGPGEVLPAGHWEFQPGPLVLGGRVYVQARQRGTGRGARAAREEVRTRAHLLAIDLRTGRPDWIRFLALGADLKPEASNRIGPSSGFEAAAQPLALAGGSIVASTDLGIAACVDAADGRVAWGFRYRRRAIEAPGWAASSGPATGTACSPMIAPGNAPGLARAILLAPSDSDFLYWLRGGESESGSLELRPPEPIGRASELLGGDGSAALVLMDLGTLHTVSSWRAATGDRIDSLYLGRGDASGWSALVSASRVLLATGREVYVLDREQDLFLLDREPLALGSSWSEGRGGSISAAGGRIYVVDDRGLSVLAVAP